MAKDESEQLPTQAYRSACGTAPHTHPTVATHAWWGWTSVRRWRWSGQYLEERKPPGIVARDTDYCLYLWSLLFRDFGDLYLIHGTPLAGPGTPPPRLQKIRFFKVKFIGSY